VDHSPNVCAGPFGALYDAYIERERISRPVGKLIWGIDTRPFYASFKVIGEVPAGATILDVPCGGGVALRALTPEQDVRYVAADLAVPMLARVRRRVATRGLHQVDVVAADMCALPFENAMADLCLSYSGLHCVPDPERAVHEVARCLKPGGRLVGTTFLAGGARRQRLLFELGRRRGHPMPTFDADELRGWLSDAGIDSPEVDSDTGFVLFGGLKRSAPHDGGPRPGPSV
jgi:SAM-dependent methyltransferase